MFLVLIVYHSAIKMWGAIEDFNFK